MKKYMFEFLMDGDFFYIEVKAEGSESAYKIGQRMASSWDCTFVNYKEIV